MNSHQYYTFKFNSSRLKEFNYDIQLDIEKAIEYGELIALFENQFIRSINYIHNRKVNISLVESLKKQKDDILKNTHSDSNVIKLKEINRQLHELFFVPEYVTIVMESNSHYKYMFKNKLKINGKTFRRFNSSASQARTSTVLFIEDETADKLEKIIDNGRDLTKKLVPSKLNAYRGLAGSSTLTVSAPKFCVVPDYESPTEVKVNFVTETDKHEDDEIEVKTITEMFNRFDGQGIISVELATKWAEELGLDYIPAQWCLRNSFLKGMVCTFDIKKFIQEVNNGNSYIKTSYKDKNGKNKIVNLNEYELIISESQFKLWDSWNSVENYAKCCEENHLQWGVSLHSPKKDKDLLKMNYQFLQTLNLDEEAIEKVCGKFVDWITGVTSKDINQTLLFLLGDNVNEDKLNHFLENSDNNWVKALLYQPKLIHDKYIKKKVYDLIKRKIQHACLGEIYVDGNFQTIVSDPYAQMQHVCGLEVTGLLGRNEYYSSYWNEKGVKVVDSMRAPLTFRSEHVLLNLQQSEVLDDWYRYCYTGILVNVHGEETMRWAGSDFDYDIIATTSDESIINGVYNDELPVTYTPPKSDKKIVNDKDLFKSDLFSFGSIIGSITNKSTSGFALLPTLDEKSLEYEVTMNRIKMCTKLQSAQIDKAKIGKQVKGLPSKWLKYEKVTDEDSPEIKQAKEFNNKLLLDKHPYFFIYLYKGTRNKYKKHVASYNITSLQRFGMELHDLKKVDRKTPEQHKFIKQFEHYSPVIDSDCVMNNLCKYIESVDFGIKNILKIHDDNESYKLLQSENFNIDKEKLEQVINLHKRYKKSINQLSALSTSADKNKFDENKQGKVLGQYESFQQDLLEICSNEREAAEYMIHLFYIDSPIANKELLWKVCGKQIVDNIKSKTTSYTVPISDENGNYEYLNKKYTLKKVELLNV
ncbi:RNA dependent RNA polymerase [Niallia circulans]|uniref:RNA dependent RNA polymerase n=1 Tax=Niallia circulans TaxID=1397 RepID=UPI0026F0EE99|nr:hypothetical protein [Niallia circulans]